MNNLDDPNKYSHAELVEKIKTYQFYERVELMEELVVAANAFRDKTVACKSCSCHDTYRLDALLKILVRDDG